MVEAQLGEGKRRAVFMKKMLFFVLLSFHLQAAELTEIEVIYEGNDIEINALVEFYAPANEVFDVLTDYDNFTEVSSIYLVSYWSEINDDQTEGIGFTQVQGCILFWFCKTIDRTEVVLMDRPHTIETRVTDDDLNYGITSWEFNEIDGVTTVIYSMNFDPNFWVPPVIGPWILEEFIAFKATDTLNRIESMALASIDN